MRHIPPSQLYRSLHGRLVELLPDECDSRVTNLVYLMVGIFLARSVQTGRLATHVPLRVKRVSIVRRMERFLANPRVVVRAWYAPLAHALLTKASRAGQVALIIDGSKVSFRHQLLLVAVAYHGRALPIAWTWVAHGRGHSTQTQQLALLNYVRSLLRSGVTVSLVGDTEFGHTRVLETLDAWQWSYALRQSGRIRAWPKGLADWQALDTLCPPQGEWCWWPWVLLTQVCAYPTHVLAVWQHGQRKTWLLATNVTDPHTVLRLYARRMWIEELFGDCKGHGFDLESSHLRSFLHLSRLTLAVMLLYVWLVSEGTQALLQGRTTQVDRSNRRDLSLFRLGLELIQQAITWLMPFQVHFDAVFDPLPDLFFCQIQVSGS